MLSKRKASAEPDLHAINKSQATIQFELDGTIISANENFLNAMGYTLKEIQGKHHRMFVDPAYAESTEYKEFWQKLGSGAYEAGQFQRYGKGGKEIWIEASYNPVFDKSGKPYKVLKIATDITAEKLRNADYLGQISAIGKSQAVIEFNMDGTIIIANENFLNAMGYSLAEIQGKHHSMFADPAFAASAEYKEFWKKLGRGEYSAGEYQRFGKGGKEVWIQASYNPIFDMSGTPFKVVKYASDITAQKLKNADYSGQISAIGKSQAVIEFNMDGTIITANENFLNAMGYSLTEIQGKHHSMFADSAFTTSVEYKEFWEKLRRGEYSAGEYQRFGKGGKEVWIQASYNPIFDMSGKPFKVVKYASDITAQVAARKNSQGLTEDLHGSIQAVAAAAEEMTASIGEISRNMLNSTQEVSNIASKIQQSTAITADLQSTAKSMESVVDMIRNIASQVNLLALNATIEAARAGDAGKGFAVVASEVKTLANEVNKATDDIAGKITDLQAMAAKAAESSSGVNAATESVSHSVNAVASAIEEQSSVTKEISTNMQQASSNVDALNQCIRRISEAA